MRLALCYGNRRTELVLNIRDAIGGTKYTKFIYGLSHFQSIVIWNYHLSHILSSFYLFFRRRILVETIRRVKFHLGL